MSIQSGILSVIRETSASDLLRWGPLVLVIHIFSTAIYRLFFHPLAKYPGPLFARLSTIPSWWHTTKQDRHLWLFRLQEEYGTTVRYRPDSVVINTPEAYKTIYGPKGNNTKALPFKFWPQNRDRCSTLQTIDNAEHGRKRRVLATAFSERALRDYEPYIQANLDRWCELLDQKIPGDGWSEPINFADWMNHLQFDIMGEICFGKAFGVKEEEGKHMRHLIHLLGGMMASMYPLSVSPITSLWVWLKPRGLDWLMGKFMPPDIAEWFGWVAQALEERTKKEEETRLSKDESEVRKDFFHYLFKTRDPVTGEMGYSQQELWEECQLLITAGGDTTAIIPTGVVFYLIRDQAAQDKLAEEILGTFDSAAEIVPGPKLYSCKYLRAVIQEALRAVPPVAAELYREVLPGGVVVEGNYFPGGVNVSVCTYALCYNKDVFPEPFRFRPERWIVDEENGVSKESVELAESGLCSFSAGPRGCVGKNLAYMEMSLVLAKLLYNFEIKKDPSSNLGGGDPSGRPGRQNPDQFQIYDAFVGLRDGPMIHLKRRVHA